MFYGCGVALCYLTQTTGIHVMVSHECASLSKVTFRLVTHTFELERLDFPATSRFESLSNSGPAIVSIGALPS